MNGGMFADSSSQSGLADGIAIARESLITRADVLRLKVCYIDIINSVTSDS